MIRLVLVALTVAVVGCGGSSELDAEQDGLQCEWETETVVTPDLYGSCRLVFAADGQRIRRTGAEECSEWTECLFLTQEETVEVSGKGELTARNYPCNAVELGLTHGECVF